jgi:integrase
MSLVPQHLDPNTQAKYRSIIKTYGVTADSTWADLRPAVDRIKAPNTRRSVIITLRSILGSEGAPSVPKAVRRVYGLPDPERLAEAATGPYRHLVLAMAYAGLRIGEACALRPSDVKRSGDLCFIDVWASRDNCGRVKRPKSGAGRVVIPEWLYDVLHAEDEWPAILPNSLYKWCRRRGIQPHGLRHFYATYLVRNVANVELARRQLRHANLATTLQTYVEITAMDEMAVIAGLVNPLAA